MGWLLIGFMLPFQTLLFSVILSRRFDAESLRDHWAPKWLPIIPVSCIAIINVINTVTHAPTLNATYSDGTWQWVFTYVIPIISSSSIGLAFFFYADAS